MTIICLCYRRPPAVSTFGDYSTSRFYYFHRLYDHYSVTYDKINCHLLLLLSRLCSLHCLPAVNLLTRTTKNNLRGRHSYWPLNRYLTIFLFKTNLQKPQISFQERFVTTILNNHLYFLKLNHCWITHNCFILSSGMYCMVYRFITETI